MFNTAGNNNIAALKRALNDFIQAGSGLLQTNEGFVEAKRELQKLNQNEMQRAMQIYHALCCKFK